MLRFFRNHRNRPWMNYTIALCLTVLFYLILSRLGTILDAIQAFLNFVSPVLAGIAIAYVMNPLAVILSRRLKRVTRTEKRAWGLSVIFTTLIVLIVFVLLMIMVIPQLVSSIVSLVQNFGTYASGLGNLLNDLSSQAGEHNLDISGITDFGTQLLNQLTSFLSAESGNIISTVTSIGSNVVNGVISFIMGIYFLAAKNKLLGGLAYFNSLIMPEKRYRTSAAYWNKCNSILTRFIWCDLLDGLIIGLANAAFMTIAGMPSVALISVIVGVTNLAPTFGPIIGAVLGGFLLLLVNPWHALAFLIFTIALQTVDGYVLKPKMFGALLGVPGVWILIMIIIGGRMFGVVGILLAIPVAAILSFTYKEYIVPSLERKHRESVKKAAEASQDTAPEKSAASGQTGEAQKDVKP